MTMLQLLHSKREEIFQLADKYHVGNIRVFGSIANGEDSEDSDIDFLVSPLQGCTYFQLGGLQMDLQDLFGRKIDILSDKGISPYIVDRVLREAIPL